MRLNAFLWAILGGMFLLGVYFLIMIFVSSFSDALLQLKGRWYWILLLVLGFGTQIFLYASMKSFVTTSVAETSSLAVSGGMSTTSMIACCAHHVADVAPLLGISVLALFLNQFQTPLLTLGVLSNFVGITFMLSQMQEHHLYREGFLGRLMHVPMKKALYFVILASVLIFAFTLLMAGGLG